jgi:phospholipid/cholesterol/gamma-HCH transport system substrate-binding protein
MKSWMTPFQVGLVMLAGIAAFVFMIGTVSTDLLGGGRGYTLTARIDDATGLVVDGRVMIAGIPVGTVENVTLDGDEAVLTLRVRDDVELFAGVETPGQGGEPYFLNGATLAKKSASLLGDYYLELTPGIAGERLADGDEIVNIIEPVSTDTLMEQMSGIATHLDAISVDVRRVTANLAEVLGDEEGLQRLERIAQELENTTVAVSGIAQENRAQIAAIIDNLDSLSGDARLAMTDVRGVVGDVRGIVRAAGDDVDAVMADVRALSQELRVLVAQNSGDVAGSLQTARATLERLEAAVESLNYSLDNVEVITDRVVDGEGTIGRLVNDPAIANETQTLLEGANSVLGGVTRIQTWIEMRSEYDTAGSALKNYLSLSLRPNPDKFYIFELVDDPRGSTEIIREARLQNDPDEPGAVYEETVRTTDAFRMSLLLGRRWAVTRNRSLLVGGRWGIIESTGGFGLDVWTWREALQVRADFFDFLANDYPRWRLFTMLQLDAFAPRSGFLSHLFLQGGLDDVLNDDSRSWFFGGGIRFNDLDLKGLLIAAPTPSF